MAHRDNGGMNKGLELALTTWAEITCALTLNNAPDRRGTPAASLPCAIINLGLQLKIAKLTRGLYIVTQRTATRGNGGREHALNRRDQPLTGWAGQFLGRGAGTYARME